METAIKKPINSGLSISSELSESDLTNIVFGHAAFQIMYAACKFDLFELLHSNPGITFGTLVEMLGMPVPSIETLMFGLQSLGLVVREEAEYFNSRLISDLFARRDWPVIKKTVIFEGEIVYVAQSDFTESLRTARNVGLRHIPGAPEPFYERVTKHPRLRKAFYDYMSAWSEYGRRLLLSTVDFSMVNALLDICGGDGSNAISIAESNPQLRVTTVDLPSVVESIRLKIRKSHARPRVSCRALNVLAEPFPSGFDCILFAHTLVIWDLKTVEDLLHKAHQALTPGGSVVIFSSMANNDDQGPKMAALDSVYFVCLPAVGGRIHRWSDYASILEGAGFRNLECARSDSWTPHGVIQAWK